MLNAPKPAELKIFYSISRKIKRKANTCCTWNVKVDVEKWWKIFDMATLSHVSHTTLNGLITNCLGLARVTNSRAVADKSCMAPLALRNLDVAIKRKIIF